MNRETAVVTVYNKYGGSQRLFGSKDEALDYAEQVVTDPKVEYAEVRVYDTLDLINYALQELAEASAQDEDIENGEFVGRFE